MHHDDIKPSVGTIDITKADNEAWKSVVEQVVTLARADYARVREEVAKTSGQAACQCPTCVYGHTLSLALQGVLAAITNDDLLGTEPRRINGGDVLTGLAEAVDATLVNGNIEVEDFVKVLGKCVHARLTPEQRREKVAKALGDAVLSAVEGIAKRQPAPDFKDELLDLFDR